MMTIEDFENSLSGDEPPGVADVLQAMWYERKGDWDKAHSIVQQIPSSEASWVHAYLHRREGDLGNASYWYGRSGREAARGDLDSEWRIICVSLLGLPASRR